MICRLCLKPLEISVAVQIFNSDDNYSETEVSKMIALHLQLQLTASDSISNSICQECCISIKEFHNFWVYIDQRQSEVRAEFLEVKCEGESPLDDSLVSELLEDESFEVEADTACEIEFAETPEDMDSIGYQFEPCSTNSLQDEESNLSGIQDKTAEVSRTEEDKSSKIDPIDNAQNEDLASKIEKRRKKHKKISEQRLFAMENLKKNSIVARFMQLSCDICKVEAANFSDLTTHFRTAHGVPVYAKCCNAKYMTLNKLVSHINWHLDAESLKCKICLRGYRNERCLQKHMLKHDEEKDEINHYCKICTKSFNRASNLTRHMKLVHINRYPYICDTCGKKYKDKVTFDNHLLQHKGIFLPPAQCDICKRWFKNKYRLRAHRYTHVEVEIACRFCDKVFSKRKAMTTHVTNWHKNEFEFKCNICHKSFRRALALEEHIAVHNGEQLYNCPHCPKQNRSKSNMYVHIKRCHVDEWIKSRKAKSYDPIFQAKGEDDCEEMAVQ